MFRKKNRSKKRTRAMLSAYSIIMVLIILLGILSHVLPKAKYAPIGLDDDYSDVEVGPGEWEGEMPTGGPAMLQTGEQPEAMELPEGESFAPMVGDEVTGEDLPEAESRMITDEPVSNEGMSNRSSEDVVMAGEEVSTDGATEDVMLIASETETYETLEACEEVYGEDGCMIVDGSGVEGAQLYQVLMAPILGFENAIDVCIFVMILGGFLAVMAKTKALETGIKLLVKKMHGKEYLLIVTLMLIF